MLKHMENVILSVGAGSTYQNFGSRRDICWSFAPTESMRASRFLLSQDCAVVIKGAAMVLISFANKLKLFCFNHICLVKNCETVFKRHHSWLLNKTDFVPLLNPI